MQPSAFPGLRCPACQGPFTATPPAAPAAVPDYAIWRCRCRQVPVVAGIPILQTGRIGSAQLTSAEVLALLRAGRHQDALRRLLMPPPPAPPALAPPWVQRLPSFPGLNRLKALPHAWAVRHWRRRMAAELTAADAAVPTVALLDGYFRRSGLANPDAYEYFAFRFGQPRHLVALSFVSLVHEPERPILDLCCGFGHITRSLAQRAGPQPVIGVDRNFFGLYLAKTRIAPEAAYVCAEASQPLPFADRAFAAVACVDGFHYVGNKQRAMQELKRVTHEEGLLMLVWSRNARFAYRYAGEPLPPEGYQALVADMPHRLVADRTVLARYLQRQGPPLAHATPAAALAAEPVLSVVASHRREVFRDHGPFAEWPHAEGQLRVNPLFVDDGRAAPGRVRWRRAFPSTFYEHDHPEYQHYLPAEVVVETAVVRDVMAGRRTPAVERLLAQCVVVGVPERYYPPGAGATGAPGDIPVSAAE